MNVYFIRGHYLKQPFEGLNSAEGHGAVVFDGVGFLSKKREDKTVKQNGVGERERVNEKELE